MKTIMALIVTLAVAAVYGVLMGNAVSTPTETGGWIVWVLIFVGGGMAIGHVVPKLLDRL